jgi:O-antigen ligase
MSMTAIVIIALIAPLAIALLRGVRTGTAIGVLAINAALFAALMWAFDKPAGVFVISFAACAVLYIIAFIWACASQGARARREVKARHTEMLAALKAKGA